MIIDYVDYVVGDCTAADSQYRIASCMLCRYLVAQDSLLSGGVVMVKDDSPVYFRASPGVHRSSQLLHGDVS